MVEEDKSPTRASSRVAARGRKVYKEDPSDDEEGGGGEEMPAIDTDIFALAPPMKTDANNEAVKMASEDVAGGVAKEADANSNSLTAEI